MRNFTRQLLTEWRRLELPFEGKKYIVAVSGGTDSVALATALAELSSRGKLRHRFVIGHFDHALRGAESEADARFVNELAGRLGLECVVGKAPGAEMSGAGDIEQRARNQRYGFLYQLSEKTGAAAVLTAHTLNDQAETLLLNLIRGSGLEGLAAMKKVRPLAPGSEILLVRPLLGWAGRAETVEYLRAEEVEARTDSMNEDPRFTRVAVRQRLLPVLEEFNPNIVRTLANTARLLRQEESLLEGLLQADPEFGRLVAGPEVKELLKLPDAGLFRVLRGWLVAERGDLRGLESVHYAAIRSLVRSRKSGRVVELPNFERVIKSGGRLVFEKLKVEK